MSRKANRKSNEPPGGREDGPGAGKKLWAGAFLLGGILLAFLTLCFAQATLREIYIDLHRDDYVRDELVVSSFSEGSGEGGDYAKLYGEIASSGESVWIPVFVNDPPNTPDRFRELQREGRIKGQRVPVWYLPHETPWWVSGSNRVIHVSQLDDHFGGWRTAVAITVPFAIVSIVVFLYGLKQIRGRRGEPAT